MELATKTSVTLPLPSTQLERKEKNKNEAVGEHCVSREVMLVYKVFLVFFYYQVL
jgi:hypothetical protein